MRKKNRYATGNLRRGEPGFHHRGPGTAEQRKAPVIISLAESHVGYFDFELLMAAAEKTEQRATIGDRLRNQPGLDRGDGRCLQPATKYPPAKPGDTN